MADLIETQRLQRTCAALGLDGVRAIFMDSRAARVLTRERRSMFDDEVWQWIVDHTNGDFDHLLISTTVPYLLSPAFHHLEAWNERVCGGAWGHAGQDRENEQEHAEREDDHRPGPVERGCQRRDRCREDEERPVAHRLPSAVEGEGGEHGRA